MPSLPQYRQPWARFRPIGFLKFRRTLARSTPEPPHQAKARRTLFMEAGFQPRSRPIRWRYSFTTSVVVDPVRALPLLGDSSSAARRAPLELGPRGMRGERKGTVDQEGGSK